MINHGPLPGGGFNCHLDFCCVVAHLIPVLSDESYGVLLGFLFKIVAQNVIFLRKTNVSFIRKLDVFNLLLKLVSFGRCFNMSSPNNAVMFGAAENQSEKVPFLWPHPHSQPDGPDYDPPFGKKGRATVVC